MRMSVKVSLTALAAALLLSAAVSTAGARNLSVSNQNLRTTWRSLEFAGEFVTIRCPVTLEGSFHARSIVKSPRSLIGAITRAVIKNESCTNGSAVAKLLPWHITWESFAGRLPTITSTRLLLSRFRWLLTARTIFGEVTCEIGNATDNISGDVALNAASEATTLTPTEGSNIAHLTNPEREPFGCSEGRMIGAGDVMLLGTTTRIRVTLI